MKYRKKPVIIEAEQYILGKPLPKGVCDKAHNGFKGGLHVHTIHNNQAVELETGDWIIRESDGEHFYPCKPDIFEAIYERAFE